MPDEKDAVDAIQMILQGKEVTSKDMISDGNGVKVLYENKLEYMSVNGGPQEDKESS